MMHSEMLLCMNCPSSLEHDLLALEQRSTQKLTDRISNVCACDNGDRPLLPLAVPGAVSNFLLLSSDSTYQSNGMGTAPNQAPSTVPIRPP